MANLNVNGDLSIKGNVSGGGIINLIYPIGSIYISVNSTDPKTLFGIGTWVKLPSNYTLWSCDSGAYDGTNGTISAGLPNITGEFNYATNANESSQARQHSWGAFTPYALNDGEAVFGDSGNGSYWYFNANNGADVKGIYGNSSTVQPPAIKVYMWRRTA